MHAASRPAPRVGARLPEWMTPSLAVLLVVGALIAAQAALITLSRPPIGDTREYYDYARAFWLGANGSPPFRALPVEYPPLTILPFSLTLLPPVGPFWLHFMLWTLLATLLGFAAFVRYKGWRRGLAYLVYIAFGATGVLLARFDLYPALVTLAALWAAQRRRYPLAYLLLALGVLLKLYPIFLAPLILIAQWREAGIGEGLTFARVRSAPAEVARTLLARLHAPSGLRLLGALGVFVVALALGFGVAFAINPSGAMTEFVYASARPLQLESTPAALLWLGHFAGFPVREVFTFKSHNLVGPLDVALKPLSTLALAAGCLWAYLRVAQGRLSLAQGFLAALSVVVATNKIFSPQYLIWVTPFVAEVYGFEGLWLAICALTTLIYPTLYYPAGTPLAHLGGSRLIEPAVALRSVLLLVFAVRVLLRPSPDVSISDEPGAVNPAPEYALLPDTLKRPAIPRYGPALPEGGRVES
ncbi:MAG TPA: glycosyltransferase 87 family protein [Ktedonobacterales bacterium]